MVNNNMATANVRLQCGNCPVDHRVLLNSVDELKAHYSENHAHLASVKCGLCQAVFHHKTSLIRHLTNQHLNKTEVDPTATDRPSSEVSSGQTLQYASSSCASNVGDDLDIVNQGGANDETIESEPFEPINLNAIGAKVIMALRSKATITGKALERFQDGCMTLLESQHQCIVQKITHHLSQKGCPKSEIEELVLAVGGVSNVFAGLRTIENQLSTFSNRFGVVPPKELYLGSRVEKRLDPKTNFYVDTQVNSTFQSVSIIGTLEALLSKKKIRNCIFQDSASKDGVLRSYVDGYHFKDHPFLSRHQNVIQILLFYDELEVANALGSRTSIHKMGVFFYQILNCPAHVSSKLSSIHLLALAYAEDLKKPGAYEKVLLRFCQEMKQLGSEDGVQILVDGELFILRAVLVAVTADSLAAHDLLGFLSPSAKCFCRWCMITRNELREDGNAMSQLRTKEAHDQQTIEVLAVPSLATSYGVKRGCTLNDLPHYHCIEGNIFDAFHDILEGICPLVIKLVLRHFICKRKLLSIRELNERIASFSYGVPDRKNKPSANFVRPMLLTHKKLKQTGSQMWCLMRALPFLLWDNIETSLQDAPHMELVFLLQDIMKIIFAFQVRSEDLDKLDTLIFKHHELFQALYVDRPVELERPDGQNNFGEGTEMQMDGDEFDEEGEALAADSWETSRKLNVYITNKFHHLKHYPEMIRKFGPAVRLWCAKFEACLKIFRQHAAIVCNFTNVTKTMAEMFQLSSVIMEDDLESSLEFQQGQTVMVGNLDPALTDSLFHEEEELISTNSATINGEEYRPGLFVVQSESANPQLAIITDIYIHKQASVFLCVKPWKILCLSAKYYCYRVCPDECSSISMINALALQNFRTIAPWSGSENDEIYLSLRTIFL